MSRARQVFASAVDQEASYHAALARAAEAYAARGWKVFPLTPGTKLPLKGSHGHNDASSDLEQVKAWWRDNPGCNIGLALEASGLCALDVDRHPAKNGEPARDDFATLATLEEELGALPRCPTQTSGGAGQHRLFTVAQGLQLNKYMSGASLEVKYRGFVLLEPSLHPSGRRYEWTVAPESTPAPPLPDPWLARVVKAPPVPRAEPHRPCTPCPGDGSAYGLKAVEAECWELAAMPDGSGRNNRLNEAALKVAQLVAGGELDEDFARRALLDAALASGLGEREVAATLESGWRAGLLEPRQAPPRDAARPGRRIDEPSIPSDGDYHGAGKQDETDGSSAAGHTDDDRREQSGPDRDPPEEPGPLENALVPVEVTETRRWLDEPRPTRVPFGLPTLDSLLGDGLPHGALSIMTGPPGTGKSSLAIGQILSSARVGTPSLFWSLELSVEQAHMRMVSLEREIPWGELCRREPQHRRATLEVLGQVERLPQRVMDRASLPPERLHAWIEGAAREASTRPFVAIDYGELLCEHGSRDARLEAERVVASLTGLARKYGIALLVLSSVGRGNYSADGEAPEAFMGHAKESGRWESDASVVLAIQLQGKRPEAPRDRRGWIYLAKYRFGESGKVAVSYDGMSGRWTEICEDGAPGRAGAVSDLELKAQIYQAVANCQIKSARALGKRVRGGHTRVNDMLKDMLREGELVEAEDGTIRRAGDRP